MGGVSGQGRVSGGSEGAGVLREGSDEGPEGLRPDPGLLVLDASQAQAEASYSKNGQSVP